MRRHFPLLLVFSLVLGAGAYLVLQVLDSTGGRLVYILDDAYIHLASATNLVERGVLGVTRHAFSSSTSSPVFTLILSAMVALFGRSELHPLVVNALSIPLILFLYHRLLLRHHIVGWARVLMLLVFAYTSGMLWLAFTGLEHLLHLATCLLLLSAVQEARARSSGVNLAIAASAALCVAVRYESLFLIGVIVVMLLVERRYRDALLLVAAALVPVVIYGLYSLANGAMVLPNSVIMKGMAQQDDEMSTPRHWLGYRAVLLIGRHVEYFALVVMLVSSLHLAARQRTPEYRVVLLILATLLVQIMMLGSRGAHDRYIAYLVALSIGYGMILLHDAIRAQTRLLTRIGYAGFFLILMLPLEYLWKQEIKNVPRAAKNQADQQLHMAAFVDSALPDSTSIAINDLGAVSYFTRVRITDLYALGDDDVARIWSRGDFTTRVIDSLLQARGVELLMVYPQWFRRQMRLPSTLIPIGTWTISSNIGCGGPTVSFFARDSAAYRNIAPRFRAYSETKLPADVFIQYDQVEVIREF